MTTAVGIDARQLWADPEKLLQFGREHADAYAGAEPFPHIVFDNFLPPDALRSLIDDFPGPADAAWGHFDNEREVKLALRQEERMPPRIRDFLASFNQQLFLEFLRGLTGIEGLVPDPDYFGGGLHQIRPGGVLKVHADFNIHPVTKLQRRLNVLLYLNADWDESWGGALELWHKDMSAAASKVYPVANRMVVFSTTSDSFHGHPDPLACPPGTTRKSLAWYYYSLPAGRVARHSTLFQSRPGETIFTGKEAAEAALDRLAGRMVAAAPQGVVRAAKKLTKPKGPKGF